MFSACNRSRLIGAPDVDLRGETLALELGEHFALKTTFDDLQRERSHRPVRLLHSERDLAAVDYAALLDCPLPFGVRAAVPVSTLPFCVRSNMKSID